MPLMPRRLHTRVSRVPPAALLLLHQQSWPERTWQCQYKTLSPSLSPSLPLFLSLSLPLSLSVNIFILYTFRCRNKSGNPYSVRKGEPTSAHSCSHPHSCFMHGSE